MLGRRLERLSRLAWIGERGRAEPGGGCRDCALDGARDLFDRRRQRKRVRIEERVFARRADSVQHLGDGNLREVARRQIGRRVIVAQADHAGGGECAEHDVDRMHWNAQAVRETVQRPRRLAAHEVLCDQLHDREREPLAHAVAEPRLAGFGIEIFGMLKIERHVGADQQHEPADVEPDQEQHQDGEARVDRGVARRGDHERGEYPARRLPEHAADDAGDQRRHDAHARVGNEHVEEGEGADHERVGRDLAAGEDEVSERLDGEHRLRDLRAQRGSGYAQRREHQQRADQQRAQIAAEALAEAAQLRHVPDRVERLLDLLHQRDDRVDQQGEPDRAEHADVHVLDESDQAAADLLALLAERGEQIVEQRLDLVVHAERLQHRKAQREQRHHRQQRRVDEAHRPQREFAPHDVANEHDHEPHGAHGPLLPHGQPAELRRPDVAVDALQPVEEFESHRNAAWRTPYRCAASLRLAEAARRSVARRVHDTVCRAHRAIGPALRREAFAERIGTASAPYDQQGDQRTDRGADRGGAAGGAPRILVDVPVGAPCTQARPPSGRVLKVVETVACPPDLTLKADDRFSIPLRAFVAECAEQRLGLRDQAAKRRADVVVGCCGLGFHRLSSC